MCHFTSFEGQIVDLIYVVHFFLCMIMISTFNIIQAHTLTDQKFWLCKYSQWEHRTGKKYHTHNIICTYVYLIYKYNTYVFSWNYHIVKNIHRNNIHHTFCVISLRFRDKIQFPFRQYIFFCVWENDRDTAWRMVIITLPKFPFLYRKK